MKRITTLLAAIVCSVAVHAQCQAGFAYTNAANVFSFTDSSTTSSGSIVGWGWQFGDNTAPSTQQNPQHTYEACGYYEVTLTVFTSSFCTSSFTDTVFVAQGTTPSFTFTVDTATGDVTFNGAPFSSTLEYNWNFGDSTTGTGMNVTHTYAAGTYTACLTVSDTGGFCTYTICDTVSVYIAPPTCNATWTNIGFPGGQQAFTAQPIDPDWTYSWDFGDASPFGNGFITNHTYTTAGTYTVCLTVVDTTTMCTSTYCDTVNVVFTTTCPVSFTNIYLAGNMTFTPTPFNPLNTYTWDFGDASPPQTGFVANHAYAAPGTYTVCVTMNTFDGCMSSFCDTVIVPSTIGVEEYGSGIADVTVAPNPAEEEVRIMYSLHTSQDVLLHITDVTGRVIATGNLSGAEGNNTERVSLEGVAPGAYFIVLTTRDSSVKLPLIRQ